MNLEKYYESHYPWDFGSDLDHHWRSLRPSIEDSSYSSTEEGCSPDERHSSSSEGRYLSSEGRYSSSEVRYSSREGQYSSSEVCTSESEGSSTFNAGMAHQHLPDDFQTLSIETKMSSVECLHDEGKRRKRQKRVWYPSNPVSNHVAQYANFRYYSRDSLFKTELCHIFEENGVCHFGSGCKFAHGSAELRSLVRHPQYRTKLCLNFHEKGLCDYGTRCFFIHDCK